MANFVIQTGLYCTVQKCCTNTNCISRLKILSKRAKMQGMIAVLGHKFCSNDESSTKCGKLIQLVVTSLRVDRVAASGLGLARRKIDHSLLAGNIFLNGEKVTKKSRQVVEGDVIKRISESQPKKEEMIFGQVKVVRIGDITKKGNYHVELLRNKSISLPVEEFWNKHNA